jgi:hypothetical protein
VSRRPRFAIATSPGFIAAVLLLLANDHVLKAAFPGIVTGKLSDVSGLFLLGTLAVALAPGRVGAALSIVAAAFVVWKSPLAQPLIDAWDLVGPFPIARVIDLTDLLALLALPLALVYSRSKYRVLPTAIIRTAMLGLAAAAVIATSKAPPRAVLQNDAAAVASFYQQARYATSLGSWRTKRRLAGAGFPVSSSWFFGMDDINSSMRCGVDDSASRMFVAAETRIAWNADHTEISLRRLALCRRFAPAGSDEALAAFEREVLVHLPDVRRVDPGREP